MGIKCATTLKKNGLVFQLKNSRKKGIDVLHDSYGSWHFFSVSQPFCRFTLVTVYEGHLMLRMCYKKKLEPSDRAMAEKSA